MHADLSCHTIFLGRSGQRILKVEMMMSLTTKPILWIKELLSDAAGEWLTHLFHDLCSGLVNSILLHDL